MSQTPRLTPSVAPIDETVVPDNQSFIDACMSNASDAAAKLGWRLGRSVLTHSYVWGLVWRMDFQMSGEVSNSDFVNRMICWGKAEDGSVSGTLVVFGEKVAPL
jgi:hypothetical protein